MATCVARPDRTIQDFATAMHAAVFVDFENLFLSLKNREELSGQRIRDLTTPGDR